jgi:hypothetical protein
LIRNEIRGNKQLLNITLAKDGQQADSGFSTSQGGKVIPVWPTTKKNGVM